MKKRTSSGSLKEVIKEVKLKQKAPVTYVAPVDKKQEKKKKKKKGLKNYVNFKYFFQLNQKLNIFLMNAMKQNIRPKLILSRCQFKRKWLITTQWNTKLNISHKLRTKPTLNTFLKKELSKKFPTRQKTLIIKQFF